MAIEDEALMSPIPGQHRFQMGAKVKRKSDGHPFEITAFYAAKRRRKAGYFCRSRMLPDRGHRERIPDEELERDAEAL